MQELVDRYRQLVASDESVETLDHALALLEDVTGIRLRWTSGRLEARGEEGRHLPALELPDLTRVAARRRRARPRVEKQTRAVRAAIALSSFLPLVDDLRPPLDARRQSLLADTCLIVFHQAYFALLPELRGREWDDERQLLTESFRRFADHLPGVADKYSVLALYYDLTGDLQRAGRCHRESLLATHSDNHEFMTALQTAWAFLIEHDLLQQAFDLLLESYPRVARQDLDEARELMALTFVYQRRFYEKQLHRRGHSGVSQAALRPSEA